MSKKTVVENEAVIRMLLRDFENTTGAISEKINSSSPLGRISNHAAKKINFKHPKKELSIFFERGPKNIMGLGVKKGQVVFGFSKVKDGIYTGALYLYDDLSEEVVFRKTIAHIRVQVEKV